MLTYLCPILFSNLLYTFIWLKFKNEQVRKLPFISKDVMELVHMHLAQPAPSLLASQMNVPPALAHMVARLLEKNPEDRYQSAQGIEADLNTMYSQLRSQGAVEMTPDQLGKKDFTGTLGRPKRLCGREADVVHMEEAFKRVCLGSLEVIMISGSSGVGKSALVGELHGLVTRRR